MPGGTLEAQGEEGKRADLVFGGVTHPSRGDNGCEGWGRAGIDLVECLSQAVDPLIDLAVAKLDFDGTPAGVIKHDDSINLIPVRVAVVVHATPEGFRHDRKVVNHGRLEQKAKRFRIAAQALRRRS